MLDEKRSTIAPATASAPPGCLGRDAPAMAVGAIYPPRGRLGLDPRDATVFAARLAAFRQHHAQLPNHRRKGGLYILDLGELRRRIAARWPAMREGVYQFVEALLARRLGGSDLYLAVEGEQIWLLFTDIDRAAAERQARRIAAEITERLCGVIAGGVACRVSTTVFDLVAGLEGVVDLEALQLRQKQAAAGPRDEAAGAAAGLVARFAQVLSPRKRLVSILALDAAAAGAMAPTAASDEERAAARDCWGVGEAARQLADHAFRRALVVRVHYATLATMRHRQKLMLACRRLPHAARRRLLIEIAGLPETLPQPRVRELVSYLRPFTLAVIVAIEPAALQNGIARAARPHERTAPTEHLSNTGIAGLSLDAAGGATAALLPALLGRARHLKVRTLCHVGGDRRFLRAALIAGIDHIAGEALLANLDRATAAVARNAEAVAAVPGAGDPAAPRYGQREPSLPTGPVAQSDAS